MMRILFLVPLLLSALPASAQVMVLGEGPAEACYRAALTGDQGSRSALEDCDKALDGLLSRKDTAATYVNRGVLLMRKGTFERAIADYEDALAIRPDLPEAHINHGVALFHLQDYTAAKPAYDTALSLGTEREAIARYNRALVFEKLGDLRAAYDDLQAVVALKPDWEQARETLSRYKRVRTQS